MPNTLDVINNTVNQGYDENEARRNVEKELTSRDVEQRRNTGQESPQRAPETNNPAPPPAQPAYSKEDIEALKKEIAGLKQTRASEQKQYEQQKKVLRTLENRSLGTDIDNVLNGIKGKYADVAKSFGYDINKIMNDTKKIMSAAAKKGIYTPPETAFYEIVGRSGILEKAHELMEADKHRRNLYDGELSNEVDERDDAIDLTEMTDEQIKRFMQKQETVR
jgi:hypothetical protein